MQIKPKEGKRMNIWKNERTTFAGCLMAKKKK